MSHNHQSSSFTRRSFLQATSLAAGTLALGRWSSAIAASPLLTVGSRTIEVNKKAATVFGIVNAAGKPGILASEGDRLAGMVTNQSGEPLQLHWHGQVRAAADQDRARPDGGALGDSGVIRADAGHALDALAHLERAAATGGTDGHARKGRG
jgi:hypothetical protein